MGLADEASRRVVQALADVSDTLTPSSARPWPSASTGITATEVERARQRARYHPLAWPTASS